MATSAFLVRIGIWIGRLSGAWIVLWLLAFQAQAADGKSLNGVALVIGQSAYEHLTPLANPKNDAENVERLLDDLGFDVRSASDRDAKRLSRELDRFVEDAAGADVALLYYSGHGIEAGGENFLIPIDADATATDGGLVPLSHIIQRLQASVPVTIVLLDACRSDPFPPGTLVRPSPDAKAAPIGVGGLGGPRGGVALTRAGSRDEALGTVIGFAAEPGKVALDGPAGGMSPYAAALTRHLSAMGGEEFGTVLRMVAEEVYLKTGGRQRPWVNESLRRLLYFGRAAADPEGDDGDILKERRRLLLTIAALPETGRGRVEAIASAGGVPMDAVYGVLAALGQDAPSDPAELERLLQSQTVRLKDMVADRRAIQSTDAEIVRLAGLADQALGEGALSTAVGLLDRAKARVATLDAAVYEAEENIGKRRREFASVYARSGDAAALAFRDADAARDYAEAFNQIERWDDDLAFDYKTRQTGALLRHGDWRGDAGALQTVIAESETASRIALNFPDRTRWARSRVAAAEANRLLGERGNDFARMKTSIALYREAKDAIDRTREPAVWAAVMNDLGNALSQAGAMNADPVMLTEAVHTYEWAMTELQTTATAGELTAAISNLGKAHLDLGNHWRALGRWTLATESLYRAGNQFEHALYRTGRASDPLRWGSIQNNLGNVYQALAETRRADPGNGMIAAEATGLDVNAVISYSHALQEIRRDNAPFVWAQIQYNLSRSLFTVGMEAPDDNNAALSLRGSAEAKEAALSEMTEANASGRIVTIRAELGNVCQALGERLKDPNEQAVEFAKAADAYRSALLLVDKAADPDLWAQLHHDIGRSLMRKGEAGVGLPAYREALATYQDALSVRTPDRNALDWTLSRAGVANAAVAIAIATSDRVGLAEAKAMTSAVMADIAPLTADYDGVLAERLAEIDKALAAMNGRK